MHTHKERVAEEQRHLLCSGKPPALALTLVFSHARSTLKRRCINFPAFLTPLSQFSSSTAALKALAQTCSWCLLVSIEDGEPYVRSNAMPFRRQGPGSLAFCSALLTHDTPSWLHVKAKASAIQQPQIFLGKVKTSRDLQGRREIYSIKAVSLNCKGHWETMPS